MSVDFPEFLKDSLVTRHGSIVSNVEFPYFNNSLVDFINQFGSLYYGTLYKRIFLEKFSSEKTYFLNMLINATEVKELYQPLWFKQHLLRQRITDVWRWPCLINEITNNLYWNNGHGRFFAEGMTQPTPWDKLNVLLLQDKESAPDKFLSSSQTIESDEDLHNIINIEYPGNQAFPPSINISLKHKNNCLLLESLYDGNRSHNTDAGKNYLEDFINWKSKYGSHPRLWIYTDWPEQVQDSSNYWEIIHAGPAAGNTLKEAFIYNYHNSPAHGNDHVLYVYNPRSIDVSDLLCWVGLAFSSYISTNWDFALVRPDHSYKTSRFEFGYIE